MLILPMILTLLLSLLGHFSSYRKRSQWETHLVNPWVPVCCRIPPSVSNTPTVRIVCSWCPPREVWNTAPSCHRECQRERNCCPRGRTPRVDQTDPRIARLRGCRPAMESDSDQTNNTASASNTLLKCPIKIRSERGDQCSAIGRNDSDLKLQIGYLSDVKLNTMLVQNRKCWRNGFWMIGKLV